MVEPEKKRARTLTYSLDSMIESNKNLTPILDDDYHVDECPLVEFYAGKIKEKKSISAVVARLGALLPMHKRYSHLKRVRNATDVLLCPVSDTNTESLKQSLSEISTLIDDDLFKIFVAAAKPALKRQNDKAKTLWPCNFHPDAELERLTGGAYFSQIELAKHRKYMVAAFRVAIHHSSDGGVVVVDPTIDSIVAVGYDLRHANPYQHPVMIAIDNVARSQGGGAWSETDERATEIQGIPDEVLGALRHGRDPPLNFGARSWKPKGAEDGPYICTGYDFYITREPCIMCAMALVHARVANVFFATPNVSAGGVMSVCKLHCAKDLNHHYRVFTGFF